MRLTTGCVAWPFLSMCRLRFIPIAMADFQPTAASAAGRIIGTCTTLCPSPEIRDRLSSRGISQLENPEIVIAGGTTVPRAVKKFARSDAAKVPKPEDLRTEDALQRSMGFLLRDVLDFGELTLEDGTKTPAPFHAKYAFMWDRIRSICNDYTIQSHVRSLDAIRVVELGARFFILSSFATKFFPETSNGQFSLKLHNEAITKCISQATDLYKAYRRDHPDHSGPVSLEEEITAYRLMLAFNDRGLATDILALPDDLRNARYTQYALRVSTAAKAKNIGLLVKLANAGSPLIACVIQHIIQTCQEPPLGVIMDAAPPGNRVCEISEEQLEAFGLDKADVTKLGEVVAADTPQKKLDALPAGMILLPASKADRAYTSFTPGHGYISDVILDAITAIAAKYDGDFDLDPDRDHPSTTRAGNGYTGADGKPALLRLAPVLFARFDGPTDKGLSLKRELMNVSSKYRPRPLGDGDGVSFRYKPDDSIEVVGKDSPKSAKKKLNEYTPPTPREEAQSRPHEQAQTKQRQAPNPFAALGGVVRAGAAKSITGNPFGHRAKEQEKIKEKGRNPVTPEAAQVKPQPATTGDGEKVELKRSAAALPAWSFPAPKPSTPTPAPAPPMVPRRTEPAPAPPQTAPHPTPVLQPPKPAQPSPPTPPTPTPPPKPVEYDPPSPTVAQLDYADGYRAWAMLCRVFSAWRRVDSDEIDWIRILVDTLDRFPGPRLSMTIAVAPTYLRQTDWAHHLASVLLAHGVRSTVVPSSGHVPSHWAATPDIIVTHFTPTPTHEWGVASTPWVTRGMGPRLLCRAARAVLRDRLQLLGPDGLRTRTPFSGSETIIEAVSRVMGTRRSVGAFNKAVAAVENTFHAHAARLAECRATLFTEPSDDEWTPLIDDIRSLPIPERSSPTMIDLGYTGSDSARIASVLNGGDVTKLKAILLDLRKAVRKAGPDALGVSKGSAELMLQKIISARLSGSIGYLYIPLESDMEPLPDFGAFTPKRVMHAEAVELICIIEGLLPVNSPERSGKRARVG
ncbi:SAC3/GANP/Nin1/mts3/eIF-3 p25 [Carpediemonas membranifera]|uniref:SAC3/GANP/Nin1/mts3/eIF-3 p25 n=1 Tax=Carpediemonas membranifera TaxID=201153 RepID=A0A8J6AYV4_9EUKA|nr:SAC3/GANP/Nin1/mts3/eIF-3 p25 [Carpediemonas membranifera]|eukprot:KAG9395735.1 SAC3/GANP/Nin1/mts3/eIF-3 p25 [Carpediemonas membranifera]